MRQITAMTAVLILSFLALGRPAQAIPRSDTRIAVDAQTGDVLTAVRSQTSWHPASLTKMMTLYLLFDALDRGKVTMNTRIKLSRRAARQPPSKLGLGPGGRIAVRDAIPALAIKSANDIAMAVAEHLGRTEGKFANLMTKTARKLGMRRTNFRNASGLHHSQQVTTARDMAILAVALIRDYPQYYRYFGQKKFRFGKRVYNNHNPMLKSYSGMDGLKTGYIYKAGFNLAASVKRDQRRVVAVVLGGDSPRQRSKIMKAALDLAFERLDDPNRKHITTRLPVRLKAPPPVPRPRLHRQRTKPVLSAAVSVAPAAPIPRINPKREATVERLVASFSPLPSPPTHLTAQRDTRLMSVVPVPRALPSTTLSSITLPPRRPAIARARTGVVQSSAPGGFGVQIGAFRSKGEASKRLAKVIKGLPNQLGEPNPTVAQYNDAKHGTYFRARLFGFDTHAAAAKTCQWLKDRRTDCIIVASAR